MADQRGQAAVELVAALPALLLAALVALQLLAAGYALTLADGAAEAGALALASGASAAPAARAALPGWARDDVDVAVDDGRVTVRLRPPSPLRSIADRLAVSSSASARPAG
jgi:Flp pilus assembly protein TadG